MARFHINPRTGNPGVCKAMKACPFGGAEDHYDTAEDARRAYEDKQHAFKSVTPMKTMTHKELRKALLEEAGLSPAETKQLERAVTLAENLHDGQVRKALIQGRANTPYIEHPLRNALRLVRLGVKDPAVLEATVLHDTVEDCSVKFVNEKVGEATPEPYARSILSKHIASEFSPRTEVLVLAVSNPYQTPEERRLLSAAEKNTMYGDHVRAAISQDADVYLVKVVDFIDNAGSLHHSVEHELKGARRLAGKYLPLVPVFKEHLDSHPLGLSRRARDEIFERLDRTEKRLKALLES